VKYWARLGCWILQCYGPFSLGASFETDEPLISLNFNFGGAGWGPRLAADTESVDTGARLYFGYSIIYNSSCTGEGSGVCLF
jgi:hypothetical protein